MDESHAKKLRIEPRPFSRRKACDLCRKKKIKCNVAFPSCSNCTLYGEQCSLAALVTHTNSNTVFESHRNIRVSAPELYYNSEILVSSPFDSNLSSNIIGSSTSITPTFPLFPNDFPRSYPLGVVEEALVSPVTSTIPPREESLPLIEEYFRRFNAFIPLFSEPHFMRMVSELYTQPPTQRDDISRAALNVVLAISHRMRAMCVHLHDKRRIEEEDFKASGHLREAQAVLSELTTRNYGLIGIQIMLGMALVFLGTSNRAPASILIAAAIRMSHQNHLNIRSQHDLDGSLFDPDVLSQRRRVFWVAYILDREISLLQLQPFLQDDADIDLDLPSISPEDGAGDIYSDDCCARVNHFRLKVQLACIQGKIYRTLYSVRASKQNGQTLRTVIKAISKELQEWKEAIPREFQMEHVAEYLSSISLIHMFSVHTTYFQCLTKLYRVTHDNNWVQDSGFFNAKGHCTPRISTFPNFIPSAWPEILQTARQCISFTLLIPRGDYAYMWSTLCSLVTAMVILLVNILNIPDYPLAQSDLRLVNSLLVVTTQLSEIAKVDVFSRINQFCLELGNKAKLTIAGQLEGQMLSDTRKRKQGLLEENYTGLSS